MREACHDSDMTEIYLRFHVFPGPSFFSHRLARHVTVMLAQSNPWASLLPQSVMDDHGTCNFNNRAYAPSDRVQRGGRSAVQPCHDQT
jgi:hypothetical protein